MYVNRHRGINGRGGGYSSSWIHASYRMRVYMVDGNYDSLSFRIIKLLNNKTTTNMSFFPKMIPVKGGTYLKGDVFDPNYKPNPQVVEDLEMSDCTIMFQEYDYFCEETGRSKPDDATWGRGERPVINVNWFDAVDYCNWLSEQQGLVPFYIVEKQGSEIVVADNPDPEAKYGYRLPTDTEWEYCAREGGKPVKYGNGKNEALSTEINFADTSPGGINRQQTIPCRELPPNALGFHQMSGNVWELTNTIY